MEMTHSTLDFAPDGSGWLYIYDAGNRLETVTGPDGVLLVSYKYDENSNRTGIVTPEGYQIFREYDSCDRLISERVLDKANGIDRTAAITYDLAGNIRKVTRCGKGQEPWDVQFDYDLKDRITHVKDCLGPVFRYGYDKNDRLTEEVLPQAAKNAELENRNTYTYNPYGQLLSKMDGKGRIQEENRYLPDGKLAASRNAAGNELEYTYGINDLETEIHTTRSRKENRAVQSYSYDVNGRITGVIDGNENQTGYSIDSWGRIREVQNADGGKEGYTYDYAGNITSTTDANGGIITYRYNSQGKVCEIIDQGGNSETYRYDREGRMVLHIDRNGNQVRTSYNVDDQPVLETAVDQDGLNPVTRSWEYDGSGNVIKAVAGGFCYTYVYRPDGKLLKKSSSGRTLISCTYFADGSLGSLTDISGKTVYYSYDWRGKLLGIKAEDGTEIARYSHTPSGKLKEIRHGNGMHTMYVYDTDENIIQLTLKKDTGEVIFDYHYEYDLNGNRTLKAGSCILPGEESLKEQVVRYQYDSMDRLTKEQYQNEPVQYVYDKCGNRLEKCALASRSTYCYNEKNQLTLVKNGDRETSYRYDAQGNVLEEIGGDGRTEYGYNALNQQVSVSTAAGRRQENQYDAEYLRAAVNENGVLSQFVFYNGELLSESNSDSTVKSRYILGYGVAAGWNQEQRRYHSYHADEQNSTVYITDTEQSIRSSYQYDAFGTIQGSSEHYPNRVLYTGQQYDRLTRQYYLRARYYNPIVGRFLQEDVYRGDGLNLYAYCANNPVIYYDPSGYENTILPNGSRTNWGREHGRDNARHNNAIEGELDWASSSGATNLAKNRVQRDINGNRVYYTNPETGKTGYIKPDAAYTMDGVRFNTNYVSNSNSPSEMEREIAAFNNMANADPNAVNTLIIEYDDPFVPNSDEKKNNREGKENECK